MKKVQTLPFLRITNLHKWEILAVNPHQRQEGHLHWHFIFSLTLSGFIRFIIILNIHALLHRVCTPSKTPVNLDSKDVQIVHTDIKCSTSLWFYKICINWQLQRRKVHSVDNFCQTKDRHCKALLWCALCGSQTSNFFFCVFASSPGSGPGILIGLLIWEDSCFPWVTDFKRAGEETPFYGKVTLFEKTCDLWAVLFIYFIVWKFLANKQLSGFRFRDKKIKWVCGMKPSFWNNFVLLM